MTRLRSKRSGGQAARAAAAKAGWFSCAELAALKLPGLPATNRGVAAYAQREGWDRATDDSGAPMRRRRKGRGGGWEYSVRLLPPDAQLALRLKQNDPMAKLIQSSRAEAAVLHGELRAEIRRGRKLLAALTAVNDLIADGREVR
ncbi:MAG: hypothetical protein KIS81_00780 [Maricaulaceae bacterium]|nr:hypothetical protein [Maricaulaceae bacterium]